VHWL
jgi:hypothetical protein